MTDANGEGGLDLSQLALSFDEAKAIARRWLAAEYAERWAFEPVRLPPRRLALIPSDPVTLTQLGVGHLSSANLRQLDGVDHLDEMAEFGRTVAAKVSASHLAGFV